LPLLLLALPRVGIVKDVILEEEEEEGESEGRRVRFLTVRAIGWRYDCAKSTACCSNTSWFDSSSSV
jgi:hypothetical protein